MKKSVVHNDPQDKDNQGRFTGPAEIVVLEK
jgi:hypothetical protein